MTPLNSGHSPGKLFFIIILMLAHAASQIRVAGIWVVAKLTGDSEAFLKPIMLLASVSSAKRNVIIARA